MIDKIYVFDDVIDLDYQNKIKSVLTEEGIHNNKYFPWFLIGDITATDSGNQKRRAFTHQYVDYDVGIMSDFHDLFEDLIKASCSKINVEEVDVYQGRSFLQLASNIKKEDVDSPHVDMPHQHFVMLYYVCDSDGDTIIYDKKCETFEEFKNMIDSNTKTFNIQKKITPKQGRVVLFDGLLYHTAEQPNEDIRCIVNYDLVDLSVDSHI